MALLHVFALVSPARWATHVVDELNLRLAGQLTADVQQIGRGISILVPVDSQRASMDGLRAIQDAAADVEVAFAADPSQSGLQRLRITLSVGATRPNS